MADEEQKKYTEDNIKTIKGMNHIRLRPGMYIGSLKSEEITDGLYVLLKEVIDNSIDEFAVKSCKKIIVDVDEKTAKVRDDGRGIPHEKLVDCVSELNTGAKFDSEAFTNSVGTNGVGLKAVNALSSRFVARSYRDGRFKEVIFERGEKVSAPKTRKIDENEHGTEIEFTPDDGSEFFADYKFDLEKVEGMIKNYIWVNKGLQIIFNGKSYKSKNGLADLISEKVGDEEKVYDVIYSKNDTIEFAFTHLQSSDIDEYYSFANGQYTINGGTHQSYFKEAISNAIITFYGKKKEWNSQDVREGLVASIAVKVKTPLFDSQTKLKLTNTENRTDIMSFVNEKVTDYLLKNKNDATKLLDKINTSIKKNKEIQEVRKNSKKAQSVVKINIPDLRDCKYHLTDKQKSNREKAKDSMIFICEGRSAANPFTQTRDPQTQAVFPVRGKVTNVEKKSSGIENIADENSSWKVIYESQELFNLITALGLADNKSLDNLRYSKIVIATDADNDGYHIRLLLMTFFIKFFPEIVQAEKLFILETPLFKVRNKLKVDYCYTEKERDKAVGLIKGAEVTRFKGLGEIDVKDFKKFIGPDMRLIPVTVQSFKEMINDIIFYMGNNTPARRDFIMENLIDG